MSKICLGKSFFLSKVTPVAKEPENNRFRVPIHFSTNLFTLEMIPPPPPLLHPNEVLVLKQDLSQAEPRKMMRRCDEIVTFVPSFMKIVTFLEVLKKTFSKPGSVISNLECDIL